MGLSPLGLQEILGRAPQPMVELEVTRRCHTTLWMFVAAVMAVIFSVPASRAQEITLSPEALREIAQVEGEIDRIEAQALKRLAAAPDNQVQQVELLGKLMLYDKEHTVNRNEACAFCHMPETGFTGPVSELNRTTGSYPGSVRTRFSERKPQSHGGNFLDMRATGRRLGTRRATHCLGGLVTNGRAWHGISS
jgi:cytochrome c peroxidase